MKNIKMYIIVLLFIPLLTSCGTTHKDEGVIKIENSVSSNTDIKDIYIRRTNSDSWGKDKLNLRELKPDEHKKFTIKKCNRSYDFKVIYLDDRVRYKRNKLIVCYIRKTFVFED